MKMHTLLVMALALALLPAPALASHMGQYRNNPVEHDALGMIVEPDGLSTSVLGPSVTNCVLDLPPFDGRCVADPVPKPAGAFGAVVAPGCSGAGAARRLQGQCGLWTIGGGAAGAGIIPPPVSEQGMPGDAAPGGYTPTKSSTVRFLDGRVTSTLPQVSGTYTVDLNRDVAELERLSGLSGLSGHVFPGDNFVWAWYGEWTDRNGNGVVDHHQPGSAGPTANEFTFLGSCTNFDGERDPSTIDRGLCAEEGNPNLVPPGAPCADPQSITGCAGASMHAWIFPGNHHPSGTGGDVPGNQVINWALFCGLEGPCTDDLDRDIFGDSLLGKQDEVSDDFDFHDRSGDADDTVRQWSFGGGGVSTFYGDDGLLVTMQQVYGVNCALGSGPNRREIPTCTFTDVDRQVTIDPDTEALLVGNPEQPVGGLKGTSRSAWLVVRDGSGVDTAPLTRLVESVTDSRDVYVATQGPLVGEVDDLVLNQGWSREPNTPGDRYAETSYGACSALPVGDARNPTADLDPEEIEAQHRGYCNVGLGGPGTAYDAYRASGRGFFDVQLSRNAVYGVPISLVPGQSCQYCQWGFPFLDVPFHPEPTGVPPVAGHQRTLGPGGYYFSGVMGVWHDAPKTLDESLFPDPTGTTLVTYPPDGWVGLVERDSGQWRYRNFLPLECTTEEDAGMASSLHEAAECNPYLDGNVDDPQDYTAKENGGEFQGSCNEASLFLSLRPADGTMDSQLIVWRNHGQGLQPDPLDLNNDGSSQTLPTLEPYGPGPVSPLNIGATCFGRFFQHTAYVIWPTGNTGDLIVTRMTQSVQLGDIDGDGDLDADVITDEDHYAPYEPL